MTDLKIESRLSCRYCVICETSGCCSVQLKQGLTVGLQFAGVGVIAVFTGVFPSCIGIATTLPMEGGTDAARVSGDIYSAAIE